MKNFKQLTDKQLVQLYAEGNYEAFDELLERNKQDLFNYILFLVDGNTDRANDVFQDTFIKAIVAIRDGKYSESDKFSGWLARIARNVVLDSIRAKRHRPEVSHEITNSEGEVCYDLLNKVNLCEPNIESQLIKEQSELDVQRMIARLPEDQRKVVKMRYYEDMSFKEIAAQTGVSINTALGRMRYGLINLRHMAAQYKIV